MANKTTLTRLKLDPHFSKTIETNLNVWSHDQNSYEIKFEFYDHQCNKPISLKNAVGRVLLLFSGEGNKKHVLNLDIESEVLGLAKIVIPKRILGYEGIVNAHIYIDFEGKTHDFGNFLFRMKRSAIDGDFPELETVYISEFEKALEEIQEILHEFDGFETDINNKLDKITTNINETETNVLTKLDELDKKIDDKDVAKQSEVEVIHNRLTHGADYIAPPVQGYKKGDIWYFSEGSHFPGMNLISLKNEQTTELKSVVFFDSYKGSTILEKDTDITLMVEANLRDGVDNKFLMYARNKKSQTNSSDRTQRFETTTTPKMFKTTVRNNVLNDMPQLGVMAHDGAGNKGVALLDFTKPFLCLGKTDTYSLNPYDVIKENRLLIATKDNDNFDFNDWVAYDGETYKPNFLDMQAQIDELKNAILNQGGTM